MKILLDHNVPHFVVGLIEGHQTTTAFDEGFDDLVNGRLIAAPEEAGFEVMITLDRNLQFQQNLGKTRLKFIVLVPGGQKPRHFESLIDGIQDVLGRFDELDQVTQISSIRARGQR